MAFLVIVIITLAILASYVLTVALDLGAELESFVVSCLDNNYCRRCAAGPNHLLQRRDIHPEAWICLYCRVIYWYDIDQQALIPQYHLNCC